MYDTASEANLSRPENVRGFFTQNVELFLIRLKKGINIAVKQLRCNNVGFIMFK